MKFFLFLSLVVIVTLHAKSQSLYQYTIFDINGDTIHLKTDSTRMLFIIAPVNPSDTLISHIAAFKNKYGNQIKVIGVLSREDGYNDANKTVVKQIYDTTGVILTEGVYTHKTSGEQQAPFMKLFTHKDMNWYFDTDVVGVGQKFFVSRFGRLHAVLRPQTPLEGPAIKRIMEPTAVQNPE